MTEAAPHVPVLLQPILDAVAPLSGTWIDGTMGAGGYSRALLEAGASHLIGLDRDPLAHDMAAAWGAPYGDRLQTVKTVFSRMDEVATGVDGVVLDLGVSSMQLDRADRGFSFLRDGPLDMRMGDDGLTAADIVNDAPEGMLADILHRYGEERAARRIARAIIRTRTETPFVSTLQLAETVAANLPRPKPGQSHPATRSFQAIRIAVNDEFGELAEGLQAAERALAPGGWLAVVTFHSVEDRAVKRFLAARSDAGGGGSRHLPERAARAPAFEVVGKAIGPTEAEVAANPRARSARLRVARRTDAPAGTVTRRELGLPEAVISKGMS
ncbi:ribosomal RNA small subunit methyltransferase H [Jannaschia pagri]|uniref:Ribosomal RNA small subunit methyltransferase H n=1 Tax=Jannaschia pagri TaxID=2829797 RepID=A0ABQ4NJ57_9RHOB|nr:MULTISPECIES: 16S rRNA (cytosine(1402)-N(4))-methyltransferase RsmH [unclassified Jannaschia]GIT90621.1 ribosomal RNA small subunit methyltransferase H [Jannaschia sp. AI_61]GIT94453.1 ribosomal RNA small subunit methyltransferase H [Jannaschia sp. AI_62]